MAYSYKGSISFGLVYIPVTLHASVKSQDVGFNMLDKNTMSRVKYKKTCADCDGREIKQEDIVKGFEYDDDKYVIFTDEDFEKLKTLKDKSITIEKFVDLEQIDPIYYEKSYYVNPTGAENAFALLLKAMEETGKAGIAKAVLGNRESLISLRAKDGFMLLNTLFFADEVQKNPAKEIKANFKDSELKIAKSLIEGMSGDFIATDYKDGYRERIKAAIEQKIAGKEVVKVQEKEARPITDLMDALMESLKRLQPPAKKTRKKATAKAEKSAQ